MAKLALVLLLFSLGMAMQLVQSTKEDPKEVDEWIQKFHHAKEKVSRLNFYFHDTLSGKNSSAVEVAEASITMKSPTLFGLLNIFDDPLTEGPEPTSKLVGRAQVLHPILEMPIIGGTGAFRLARGFVQAKAHYLNLMSGDAILENHVVAIHY
nr:dirigent protein 23 [Quercus suber]POF07950.1 dirigent protein 23 [Quercus suber]